MLMNNKLIVYSDKIDLFIFYKQCSTHTHRDKYTHTLGQMTQGKKNKKKEEKVKFMQLFEVDGLRRPN